MSSTSSEPKKKRGFGWATVADVARIADVSLITVSRTFNTPDRVAPSTRDKVLAAAEEIGYVPNLVAGELATQRSRVVAAIVPTLANSNFARTMEGLAAGLREHGYELLIASTGFAPDREAEAVAALVRRRPDGIVLTGNNHSPRLLALLKSARIPVVETWSLKDPVYDMAVGFSDFAATYSLTRHVISSGRRKIGYIDFHTAGVGRYTERKEGFLSALREAGLTDRLIVGSEPGQDYQSGRRALSALIEREPQLDAVIGCTDVHAVGAMFECQVRGWPIPDRLAVAGFGDFEIAAAIPPGLTTVRSHAYEIGYEAASMLMVRLRGEHPHPSSRDVGFELVVRGSA